MNIPFYPMRPSTGAPRLHDPNNDQRHELHRLESPCDRIASVCYKCIYRPKVDGDRVLVDLHAEVAWNRNGDQYTKPVPFDALRDFASTSLWSSESQYLDVEMLTKHMVRKGQAVILDAPNREVSFKEFMDRLGIQYPIRCGTMVNANDHVALLPYYDPEHVEVDLIAQYNNIKDRAASYMEKYDETTPFYEGLVAVQKDSAYIKQIANPRKVTHLWKKHRFSK